MVLPDAVGPVRYQQSSAGGHDGSNDIRSSRLRRVPDLSVGNCMECGYQRSGKGRFRATREF